MTENSSPQPQGRTLRNRLLLPGLFFLCGIAATGWFALNTETGQSLLAPTQPTPALTVDPARLTQPVSASPPADVAARITELEARLARAEASTGLGTASAQGSDRATGLLLAFAARRALERGQPLGPIEGELKTHFGEGAPHLVAAIASAAKQPVTLDQLQSEFETVSATLTEGGDKWWTRVTNGVANLVSVRDAAEAPESPKTIVARAGAALDRGAVARALSELEKLPNARLAADWMAKARRYSAADAALNALEAKAFEGPPPAPIEAAPILPPARVLPEPSI